MTDIEESLYFIVVSSVVVTFLFCFLALEGQQKTTFLEIYVLAINIFDQDLIENLNSALPYYTYLAVIIVCKRLYLPTPTHPLQGTTLTPTVT